MKFSLLLFLLAIKFKWASKKKPNFRKKLKQKNFTGLIKTSDNKKGRSFVIENGTVISKRGIVNKSNFALVWSDAATAFSVMASGNTDVFVKAISDSKLKIEGDGMHALWFLQLTKDMNY